MASISELPSASGKKSLNTEVNLVPFIDLLSVCICFLLMAAVWVQLGSLEVRQTFGTAAADPVNPYELDMRFSGPQKLQVQLKKSGHPDKKLLIEGPTPRELLTKLDASMLDLVAKIGVPASAVLSTAKSVNYGELIAVMDVLRKHKITNLGVAPAVDTL